MSRDYMGRHGVRAGCYPRRMRLRIGLVPLLLSTALALAAPALAGDTRFACVQPSVAVHGRDVFTACGRGMAILVAHGTADALDGALEPIGSLGALALGNHRGPKIAAAGSSLVVTAIGKGDGAPGADVWAWRSTDRGRTWSGPVRVTDEANAAQEGLHAIAANGSTVAVAWLDIRAGHMRLYGSRSTDGGATWSPNREIYRSPGGAICTCCHPSLLVAADGTLTAMFRNDLDGNRDMYLKTGGADPVRLGDVSWRLSACPMDGGGLARTRDGHVVTAWRRDRQVVVASPGQPEQIVGDGKNPAITVAGDIPIVAWESPSGLTVRAGATAPMVLDPGGHTPSTAALDDGRVLVAWQRGDQSIARTIVVQSEASARRDSRSRGSVTIAN